MDVKADAKRKLAANPSADLAGHSRLMAEDERATTNTLNDSRDAFRKRNEYGDQIRGQYT